MEAAEVKKLETVHEWLCQVVPGQRDVESVHLNRIEGDKSSQLTGLGLIKYVYEILMSVVLQLQTLHGKHGVRQAVVFIPVAATDELVFWNPKIWGDVNCKDEPPSLYIIRENQIFDEDCEEYRRPLSVPINGGNGVKAIYRSFRDQEAIDNSWEFTSGVYLIASL
ncbi:hypothetical protein [Pseudoduganella armeniaca]|uniref:hypothetical protein n=1 Tax=Pseudoduganella armeniaca TaxID=2072590 RepID=UPI0011B1F1A3|nr:hypothetical protein [Pseudoduganella armeniaca]